MSTGSCFTWHYGDEKIRQELKDNPLILLGDAENVKSNAVRQVFRSGDYYLKLDRRMGRSFRSEFNSAQMCRAENIPVTEHLAWGRSSEGSWLITRNAEGFVEAGSFFKIRREMKYYEGIAGFLKKLFQSGLYHPDLHLGNILAAPSEPRFLLVDVHGVRKRGFIDRFRLYLMHDCVMELRDTLSDDEICRLIEMCGLRHPEHFFKRSLARRARELRNAFPKRRRQILNGYFKYTRIEGDGRLVDVDAEEAELNRAEEMVTPDASELFLFHFFLNQAKIPHRRVLAFDPGKNTILLEAELPEKYRSAATAEELCRRLKFNGITSAEEDFGKGYLCNLAEVFRNNR